MQHSDFNDESNRGNHQSRHNSSSGPGTMGDNPLALMAQQAMSRANGVAPPLGSSGAGGAGGLSLVSPVTSAAHQQLFNSLSALMTLQPQLASGAPLATAMDFSPSGGSGPCSVEAEAKLVDYRGEKVAGFVIDGETMICLPQAYELFLKSMVGGLHTVYTKLKRLDITPRVCNVEQVRALRSLGSIQPGVNRCKLIACKDFDALYEDCTSTNSRPGRPAKRSPLGAVGLLEHRWSAGDASSAGCNGASTTPGLLFGGGASTAAGPGSTVAKRLRMAESFDNSTSSQTKGQSQVQGQPLPATILPGSRPHMAYGGNTVAGSRHGHNTDDRHSDQPQASNDEQSPCSPVICSSSNMPCMPNPGMPGGMMPQFFPGPNMFMHQLLQQAAVLSQHQSQQQTLGNMARDRSESAAVNDLNKCKTWPHSVNENTLPTTAMGPLNLSKGCMNTEDSKATQQSNRSHDEDGAFTDNDNSPNSTNAHSAHEQQNLASPDAAREIGPPGFPFAPVPNPLAVAAWAALYQKQQAALAMSSTHANSQQTGMLPPSTSNLQGSSTDTDTDQNQTGAATSADTADKPGASIKSRASPQLTLGTAARGTMGSLVDNLADLKMMMSAMLGKLGHTFEIANLVADKWNPSNEEIADLKAEVQRKHHEALKEQRRREQVQKRLDLEKQIRRIYQSKRETNSTKSENSPTESYTDQLVKLEAIANEMDRDESPECYNQVGNDPECETSDNGETNGNLASSQMSNESAKQRDSITPPAKLSLDDEVNKGDAGRQSSPSDMPVM